MTLALLVGGSRQSTARGRANVDPVVSAAIEGAAGLPEEEAEEARSVYEAIIRRFDASWCSRGTATSRCGEEARRKLRAMSRAPGSAEAPPTEQEDAAAETANVADAALGRARALEADSPDKSRVIYQAIIRRFAADACGMRGPSGFPCREEARRRLRVMKCEGERPARRNARSPSELASVLAAAIHSRSRARLLRYASCDVAWAVCNGDLSMPDKTPEELVDALLRTTDSATEIREDAELRTDEKAGCLVASKPPAMVFFQRVSPSSRRWKWTALCFEGADLQDLP